MQVIQNGENQRLNSYINYSRTITKANCAIRCSVCTNKFFFERGIHKAEYVSLGMNEETANFFLSVQWENGNRSKSSHLLSRQTYLSKQGDFRITLTHTYRTWLCNEYNACTHYRPLYAHVQAECVVRYVHALYTICSCISYTPKCKQWTFDKNQKSIVQKYDFWCYFYQSNGIISCICMYSQTMGNKHSRKYLSTHCLLAIHKHTFRLRDCIQLCCM